MTPKVSVLIPVHDAAAYLSQALESVAAQTFGDFEAVIVDDGSRDASREIAERWAASDGRFRVFSHPSNLGMTANWNSCLRRAAAPYVVKLDADDAMNPDFLKTMVQEMQTGAEAAFCRTVSCDERLEAVSDYLGDTGLRRAHLDPLLRHERRGHEWYQLCFSDIQLWHSNAQIHRRQTLSAMGGWDERWGCASDTDLILRVLERNTTVVHNPYRGILYRHRAGSVSAEYRRDRRLLVEGLLIRLLSLQRYHAASGALTGPLRREWWRHWENWHSVRDEILKGDGFPGPFLDRVRPAVAAIQPPTAGARAAGWLRERASRLKRRLRRAL